MIKVILFDADGVLINRKEYFSHHYAKTRNISYEKIEPFFKNEFQQCLIGKTDLKRVLAPYLSNWKWNGSVDTFLAYWFEYENSIDGDMLKEVEALKEKRIQCCLATNNEKYRSEFIWREMTFGDTFANMFSSAYIGTTKDDQFFFTEVMNSLPGINKEEVLLWDDDETNIESAKMFGIKAELFTNRLDYLEKMKSYI